MIKQSIDRLLEKKRNNPRARLRPAQHTGRTSCDALPAGCSGAQHTAAAAAAAKVRAIEEQNQTLFRGLRGV